MQLTMWLQMEDCPFCSQYSRLLIFAIETNYREECHRQLCPLVILTSGLVQQLLGQHRNLSTHVSSWHDIAPTHPREHNRGPLARTFGQSQDMRSTSLWPLPWHCRLLAELGDTADILYEVKLSLNRLWRPIALWDVEAPKFSRQSAHRWRWGSQPYAPAALYPQEYSWYSFLVDAESNPGP
jgi:hypothetical protein